MSDSTRVLLIGDDELTSVTARGCCDDVRTLLAAMALGSEAREAFLHEQTVYLVKHDGDITPCAPGGVPA